MFNSATIAFLLVTAASSIIAAPFNFKRPTGCTGCAFPPATLSKIREEGIEAREPKLGGAALNIGGQVAGGVGGAAATWALNKIREEDIEARERKFIGGGIIRPSWPGLKIREDIEARVFNFKPVRTEPIRTGGIVHPFREDIEVREPKLGGAALNIGGQVAGGVGGAAATWALNKLREEDIEAREPRFMDGGIVRPPWAGLKIREDIDARVFNFKPMRKDPGAMVNMLREEDIEVREPRRCDGCALNPYAGLKYIREKSLEAREPKRGGGAALNIAGQVAGGVGGAAATWALNKIREDELVARFVNPAFENMMNEAREDGIDIREIFEALDARDF